MPHNRVGAHSDGIAAPFASHGEVCVAARHAIGARILFITIAVTMLERPQGPQSGPMFQIDTILLKFEFPAFDENSRRTCVNTGENLRGIAKDNFKPVC